MDGQTILLYTEVKRLLDLVRSAAKPCAAPILKAYQPFNLRTQDGRRIQRFLKRISKKLEIHVTNWLFGDFLLVNARPKDSLNHETYPF